MVARFLVLVVIVAGALVAAERVPALREKLPWLPDIPGLSVASGPKTATAEGGGRGAGQGTPGGGGGRRRGGAADGPVPVIVAGARITDVAVTADVLGTMQATNTVTVRPQIDGKLVELAFKDGQAVHRGDVLARIDAATYQAQYDQAVAKKAQDEAQLANAQVDLARYQKLAESQYGSHQQADTQKALVAQYAAQIQGDQAAVNNARAVLDYATIRSPLDGRTGIRAVDGGNIVHASDASGLVTVAQIKPIAVVFNLPQQWLRPVNAAAAAGALRIEARDGDGGTVLDTGTLDVVDNTVDVTTGTVKMKGSFPNDGDQLWPGQFINVRLYVDTLRGAVVVPSAAVQRGPDGAFVFVVKDGHAAMTPVTAGRRTETDTVLTAGLAPPAEVITTGFTKLTDGAAVTVGSSQGAADAPPDAEANGDRKGGGGDAGRRRRRGEAGDAAAKGPAEGRTGDAAPNGAGQGR